ncbi:hypothetical protein [Syntrophomonas palmitatica]|uniref:hypothetical protein n=1 Tax=Syntrophomonas palmitatica TaxID=402877 RepID=UPI0006D06E48|nr:hypothetical protein [Syntrophomonas palmitatica]
MIAVCAAGIGLIAFALIYYTVDIISAQVSLRTQLEIPKISQNKKYVLGGLAGFIVGVVLLTGTSYLAMGSIIFAGLGIGGLAGIDRVINGYKIEQLRKECILLFNAVGIYAQTGMSVPQALASSREFLPRLTPVINKILAAWTTGNIQALDILRQEVDLPECEQLVSLLLQINQAGSKNIENIVRNESRHMEERRTTYEKIRISNKPIILTLYRFLPLIVLLGLGCGFLATYAFYLLENIL